MNTSLKLKLVAMATAALGITTAGCGGADTEDTPTATEGASTTGGGEMSCSAEHRGADGQASCSAEHMGGDAPPAGGDATPPPATDG